MAQYAQLPDKSYVEFPDDWSEGQMDDAVYRDFSDQFPDRQPEEPGFIDTLLSKENRASVPESLLNVAGSAKDTAVDLGSFVKQIFNEAQAPELDAISGAQPQVLSGADIPGAAEKIGAQPTALEAIGEMGSQFMGGIKTVPSNILDFALSAGEAGADLLPEPNLDPDDPDRTILGDIYSASHLAGGKVADTLREQFVTPVLASAEEDTKAGGQMAALLPPGDIKRGMITGAGSAGHTVAALLGGPKNALKIMFGDVGGMETRKAKELMDDPGAGPLTKGLKAAGFDESGALIIGSMYGGAEIVGEKTALGLLFKKWGKGWVKDLVKFGVAETGQEMLTETLQSGLDKLTSDPDMTFGEFTDRYKDLLASLPVAIGGPTIATKGVQFAAEKGGEKIAEQDFNKRVDDALANIAEEQAKQALSPDNAQLTTNRDASRTIDPKRTTRQEGDIGPAASGKTAQAEELAQAQAAFTKADAAEAAEKLGGRSSGAQQLTAQEARDEEARILAEREKPAIQKQIQDDADVAYQQRQDDLEKQKAEDLPAAKVEQAKQDTRVQTRAVEEERQQKADVAAANKPADERPTTMEQKFQKVLDEELIAELQKTLPEQKKLEHRPTIHLPGDKATEPTPVKLTHFSKVAGLAEIDPSFHGVGVSDRESKRKSADPANWVDRSYFYMDQEVEEHKDVMLGKERYEVEVDSTRIYDAKADPDGLKEKSRFGPSLNLSLYEKNIKEAGYAGYFTDTAEQGKVAAMFEKTPVAQDGATPTVADQIKENGGYSVNLKTNAAPTDGYMVSNRSGREKQISLSKFTQADVDRYIQDNADALGEDGAHFGAWVENGDTVVLDISQQYASEREAMNAAVEHNLRAIYDVKTGEGITVAQELPETFKRQSGLADQDIEDAAGLPEMLKPQSGAGAGAASTPLESESEKEDTGFGTLHSNPFSPAMKILSDMVQNAIGQHQENLTPENPGVFTVADETGLDRTRRVFQDKFRRLEKTQKAIEEQGGKIDIDTNVHAAEERFHGKVEKDLMDFERDYLIPLIEAMAKQGVVPAQLSDYLYSRHAEERNEVIASRREDMQDGGSGWTTEHAADVRQRLESEFPGIERLAHRVWEMLEIRRSLLRTSSLAENDLIDVWEEQYDHYVPLKGRAEDGGLHPRIGAGLSIKGKESKVATGRRTEADNIVYQVVQDVTESFVRSRKNEVGEHLLNLVRDNPNPDFWTVHDEHNPGMQNTVKKGKVVRVPINLATDPGYFGVKEDGKQFFVHLKDERLARAMQNLGVEQQGLYIQTLSSITRYLSSINTALDPEFIISNFSRDIQTAILNALAEQDLHDAKVDTEKLARNMIKDVVKSMPSMYRALKDKVPRPGNEFDQYAHDFMADGAKTGFFNTRDLEGQKRYVENLLQMAEGGLIGKGMKAGKAVADMIADVNGTIENAVRLSAYINARKIMEKRGIAEGKARKRAAHLAKNLTVNFNRRGEMSTALNAHFMFFNASVQGTAQFARTMLTLRKDPVTGKRRLNYAQKVAFALVTASYISAIIQRAVSDEDDDGRSYYDKIPASVKERNMIFMDVVGENAGKNYTKIPLPYGYNIFWNLGQNTSDLRHGDLSPQDAALNMTNAILGSFNPMGISADENPGVALVKTITPTLLTPGVEIIGNSNFWGGNIWKEDKFNERTPDSAMSVNAKEHFKVLSEWLNEATGGTRYEKGGVDVSPDSIEHLFEFATGGLGRFVSRSVGAAEKIHVGDPMTQNDIPFTRKVRGEPSRYMTSANYYEVRELVLAKDDALKNMRGVDRSDFRKDNREFTPIIRAVKSADKRLSALRTRRDRELSKVDTLKETNALKRDYADRMDVEYNKVNRMWYDMLKENR